MFGNPNAPTGRFREAFPGGRFASRWQDRSIDSRTVSFTDKRESQNWIDDYGEDSDFVESAFAGYSLGPEPYSLSEPTWPVRLRDGRFLYTFSTPCLSGLMWLGLVTTNPLSTSEKVEMADRFLQSASAASIQ
jgi:hypothetical protein